VAIKKAKSASKTPALGERAQLLLKVLIEKYIAAGQPVGSKYLAQESGMDLSPATIRNVLTELEDLGLIKSPHTSAGRVPTYQGYRLFVDTMVTVKPVANMQLELIKRGLANEGNRQDLVGRASDMLSQVTQMASVVLLPRRVHASLRQIEFLPLSDNRVLAIMVINKAEVENRVIHTAKSYSADELQKVANYLNRAFAGKDILTVRENLLEEMRNTRQNADELMSSIIDIAGHAFAERDNSGEVYVKGKTNLLHFGEMSDTEKLKQMFEAFKHKQGILEILDQCMTAPGMQIFIGAESGLSELNDCSIITAPYQAEGQVLGVLGVIGPTRMHYEKVIPIVDVTAKLLGTALEFKE
jgi:heat-inducible transcriptional repressor